ncbi:MAG: cytochrome P450 [Paracoccaceae bacterium]
MLEFTQSPTEDAFVQDPYAFYERARAEAGALFHWADHDLPCALSFGAVWAILRDRRFGREVPQDLRGPHPDHQAAFWAVEDHSMLELEPPRHTRLRGLVLRAFTSRRIAALGPEITALSHQLIDGIEGDRFDLIPAFAQKLPVIVIARLLGVPEDRADDLLAWSNAMVGMYQARRTRAEEVAAAEAARGFSDFLRDYVAFRRDRPADDLITHLIAAEQEGDRLTTDELISTCILLLNAGHEATVHTIGNGVKALLEAGTGREALAPDRIEATIEEILRFDAPLHMFTRWAYEDVEVGRHVIAKGGRVACLLGAANRDPARWDQADRFDAGRSVQTNVSFGAGVHFCIGAPLARLELQLALPVLFQRCPGLRLDAAPRYADLYHFHGLAGLRLQR